MTKMTCAVLLAIGTVSVVSAAQERPVRPERPARHAEQGTLNWGWSDSWKQLRVESRGAIELTDDEGDVKSVSPNGYFEISSRGWLSLFGQRYIVQGKADGTTTRRFTLGAAERPIDAKARVWIADTIRRLVRSGFDAEGRVARILSKLGPTGVLDAISLVASDFTKAKYFTLLFKQARLDRPTTERALRQAGREIGSNFERARVLMAFVEAIPIDDAIAPAFVEATNSIGSDFEHARVLMALMARQQTPVAVKAVLDSSPRIRSDFEHARVLGQLAQKKDLAGDAVLGIVRATDSIGSDFDKLRVLLQVIATQPIEGASRQALLDTVDRIGSNHERGRVLAAMLRSGTLR